MSRFSTGRLPGMRDEVDRLVEAWQRERGDLDLRPMEVLSRVTRLGHHLDRARRRRSPSTASSPGSSTCWPRCDARGRRTSSAPADC